MKKIILSLLCLFFIGSANSQSTKLRVAVSFNTDDTFTLLGPLSTKSFNINLNDILYKQIEMLVDTNAFELTLVPFPADMSASNDPTNTGIPKKSTMQRWGKKLFDKGGYDLLLIVYKPVQTDGLNSGFCGFSYGLSTSKGIVFSLNNALVYQMNTMELLAATSIESESDYVAGFFVQDKTLPSDHTQNIETPVQMINKLNQDFALKVFQCLQSSKRKIQQK